MQKIEPAIVESQPRERIRATLIDGRVLEGPVGTTTGEFLRAAQEYAAPLMGAICDGELRELSYPLERDATVHPVLLSNSDGGRIYRRSLVLLLATAADELWPGCKISVRYAVPDGGFYCKRMDAAPFTAAELEALENHMREIVQEDDPITKRIATAEEASALFANRQDFDKVRLLEQRHRPDLTLYTLRGRDDYYFGYMVPSTRYLQYFRLIEVEDGFILQYPRKETPTDLKALSPYDKLTKVFHQADNWLHRLEVPDIGTLNRVVQDDDQVHELVLIAEALHEQNIANIAEDICERQREGVRLILIAGPSSSGKTTFAKRLAIQMLTHGLRPFTLELDNYFVDRAKTPRDTDGNLDFEALEAVQLPLFNRQLLQLIAGEEVQLPRFNFLTGESEPGRIVQLLENQVIIVEGIHGLNPRLVPDIPPEKVYRVYVSALTQLNIDIHNRVPTTDVRLLRRIVRDAEHRGYSAIQTLQRWSSVRRGEKSNIFPFQENADSMFNSALVYELAALRPLAEPLLLQVPPRTPEHIEAKRLLAFLRWVRPMQDHHLDYVPDTSLLREFVGSSSLQEYHPGALLRPKELRL
ncbi:MAG: nucleoside kinase [Anaerolineae bacterium]